MLYINAKSISGYIADLYERKNFLAIDKFAKENLKENGIRITLIDKNGLVLADSFKNINEMENHLDRPEVISALNENFGSQIRKSASLNEGLLYVALPIYKNDEKSAVLRLSIPLKNISVFSREFVEKNYLILFVIALISVAVSFFLSRSVSKRTVELTNAFKELSRGNFDIRTHIASKDELGELSNTFNAMSLQMREIFHQLRSQKEELNEIISSVSDAIMAIEKEGDIILTNESFNKRFQYDGSKISYKQIFDDEILSSHIQNYHYERPFLYEKDGETFSCAVARLKESGGYVVVFHDITQIKTLENFKKDLIGNVSHEIKTPLSSIKIYLELLENATGKKEFKEHIETINTNVERLSNIVDDLLTLSEIEDKKNLDISDFRVTELFDEMTILFEGKAQKKNIVLDFEADKNLIIKADKFRLEQALSNLISNSLRYTEKGNVRVLARIDGGKLIIEVKDSGIGIAKRHLDRVFERFYVADKSRSRKTGGTGLGLSIVKHIASLHGGSVEIESVVSQGTTVIIKIPLDNKNL
jgi:two-component system phosphate regulon sensor histidine kinase PhoR